MKNPLPKSEMTAMRDAMFKHSDGWMLNARMLRLYNDHHEAGLVNKAETTRDATRHIERVVREEIAQDRGLVWC